MSPDELIKAGFSNEEVIKFYEDRGFSQDEISPLLPAHKKPSGAGGEFQAPPEKSPTFIGASMPPDFSGRKIAGIALPIAGDIAGSMIAPQAKGATMALKLLNLLSRAGGSAVGSFGGSMAGQKIEKGDIDYGQAGIEAGLAAGGEVGMAGLGAAAKKFGKPVLELISDITFTGSAIKNRLRTKLVDKTTERATNFVNDIAPDIVKRQNVDINELGFMVEAAMDESRAAYKLYEKPLEEVAKGQGGKVSLSNTSQFLGETMDDVWQTLSSRTTRSPSQLALETSTLKEMGYTPKKGFEIRKLLFSDTAGPEQVKYILATVLQDYYQLAPSQRALREKLKIALLSDLDNIAATGGKSVADLKKEADETFKAIAQFKFVKKLFDNGITRSPETGRKKLLPHKVADMIYNSKNRVLKEMPDLWPALKKEADFYREVAPQFERESSQYMTGLGQVASRSMGGAAGGMMFGPKGVIVAEGFGAVSAYSLLSEKFRKIVAKLAGGTIKTAFKSGLHLGGRGVLFQAHESAN